MTYSPICLVRQWCASLRHGRGGDVFNYPGPSPISHRVRRKWDRKSAKEAFVWFEMLCYSADSAQFGAIAVRQGCRGYDY